MLIENLESAAIESLKSKESIVNVKSLLSSLNETNIIQEHQLCNQKPLETSSSVNEYVSCSFSLFFVFCFLFNANFFFVVYRSEYLHNQNSLKSRKENKKKATLSVEKLSSIIVPTSASGCNLCFKITEYLHGPKLTIFKYSFILACICFSAVIIFIHK